jgi:pimeloyl-ACP methyl ester carboxylesterase
VDARVLESDAKGEGRPVVLVPGGLTGWLSWIPHQQRLAGRSRAIRVQPLHNELGSRGEIMEPGYDDEVERECLRMTLDELDLGPADVAAWSGGARSMIEFSQTYPERMRSLTLVEPPATWAISGDPEMELEIAHLDAYIERVAGKPVSEEDLAEFLEMAGFVEDRSLASAHPAWERWLPHRTALANQGGLGKKDRTLEELASFDRPVLLVKGTVSTGWLRRVIDVLGRSYPRATVLDLPGSHACHIESIDAFMDAFERHLSNA